MFRRQSCSCFIFIGLLLACIKVRKERVERLTRQERLLFISTFTMTWNATEYFILLPSTRDKQGLSYQ